MSSHFQRTAWRLSLALLVVSAGLVVGLFTNGVTGFKSASAACTQCTGTWYGVADANLINQATANAWPQKPGSSYCSIEDAIAMINFEYYLNGQYGTLYNNNDSQVALGSRNQGAYYTSDMSGGQPYPGTGTNGWGYGPQNPPNAYGGRTNIAQDFGADPRSTAWMVWQDTLPNRFFHDHIYNKQQDRTPPATREGEVARATTLMGRAWSGPGSYPDPVIAFINGGMHSVLVTGMWSGSDPATNYTATIQGLVFRDSEGNQRQEFNYSYWRDGGYVPGYTMWALFYGDRYAPHDHLNTSDPEPSVGPYAVTYPAVHWYDSLNWVQRDGVYANGAWNPNNSLTAVSSSVM